ncbi:MAG: ABC transporter substrate-binding protein [Desulfuromonadales bacterium]|nr:ABC transporter substrate-binding protein [Desulfuromonadales bacterium]
MKRILMIFFLIVLVSTIGTPAGAARPEKKIGVLMWSEEVEYYEVSKGVMDQLKKEGFGGPEVKFTVENARGGKSKLAEMARRFAAAKMDMIVSIGTTATLAAAREIKDAPLVFAYVYDPVESGIARKWGNSGNNTTGASSRVSLSKLVNCLQEFAPVTRLAVLYTPGEKNSEALLKELQNVLAGSRIKVFPVILSGEEEVVQSLSVIVPTVDAIYLSGSSIVGNKVATIVDMATKANVITITHRAELAKQGVLLGVAADPYLVGRLAGAKAVKVLKGAKPSSIPIESLGRHDVMLNMKTVKAGRFQVSPSFMKSVTKVIE